MCRRHILFYLFEQKIDEKDMELLSVAAEEVSDSADTKAIIRKLKWSSTFRSK